MSRKPCPPGCTCGLHNRPVRKPHSEETKALLSERAKGRTFSMPEHAKQAISRAMQGNTNTLGKCYPNRASTGSRSHSKETRRRISDKQRGNHSWHGGAIGDFFASILCPVGYVRAHKVEYGSPRVGGRFTSEQFELDFALIDTKVNIELDGPYHMSTPEEDAARDEILKALGWRIIRIRHGGSL